jgi:nicotinate-nucleotide pyrophosphorylase (carboxylating)
MAKEFRQIEWDAVVEDDCRHIVRLAVREDLDRRCDLTTAALIEPCTDARAVVVAREAGVVCGLRAIVVVLDEMEIEAEWSPRTSDGAEVVSGTVLGTLDGPARDLLTAERLLLNFLGHLSGIATLTRAYTRQVEGTSARIYDTRKTTPGWRRLEKYAVRCGGGWNHRTGLSDAVLIKDNHLAQLARVAGGTNSPAAAVAQARRWLPGLVGEQAAALIVEVEVDSLEQLAAVLPCQPDIVLLDNMSLEQLRSAVALRAACGSRTQLEASGGVNLDTVAAIARTGVERISVGALTHSARTLDVALDWAG